MFEAVRYHDISCGHRVSGHENKCAHLHGHNYRFHFHCQATETDDIGRVIDFSVIKERLCMWLEEEFDHKFLAYYDDPIMKQIVAALSALHTEESNVVQVCSQSIVWLGFNPTAENLAAHMVNIIGPNVLQGTGVRLVKCVVEETAKCSASYTLGDCQMTDIYRISHGRLKKCAERIANKITTKLEQNTEPMKTEVFLYGVQRGGIPAMYLVLASLAEHDHGITFLVTSNVRKADFIIDDIIDSGKTRERFRKIKPGCQFLCAR